jgi:hypothetical protein
MGQYCWHVIIKILIIEFVFHRAMAVSLGMLFGRFGSTAAANVIGNLIESYCEVTYLSSAAIALICFVISFAITKKS